MENFFEEEERVKKPPLHCDLRLINYCMRDDSGADQGGRGGTRIGLNQQFQISLLHACTATENYIYARQ